MLGITAVTYCFGAMILDTLLPITSISCQRAKIKPMWGGEECGATCNGLSSAPAETGALLGVPERR